MKMDSPVKFAPVWAMWTVMMSQIGIQFLKKEEMRNKMSNMIEINKNYCENCLDTMSRMPDGFIDLTVTSPPYNLGKKHHTGGHVFNSYDEYVDDVPEDVYQGNQIKILQELYRVTSEGGSLLYNHKNRIRNGRQITPYEWLLKTDWVIKQELVWFNRSQNFDKIRFYPMTERVYWLAKSEKTKLSNVINHHDLFGRDEWRAEGTSKKHKRGFPEKMVDDFLKCFPSAKTIYDPFMGSGTTAKMAILNGRDWIGSEISEEYCKIIEERVKL
jgi:site-specific DNA-methyltransferase (adenine-specific)